MSPFRWHLVLTRPPRFSDLSRLYLVLKIDRRIEKIHLRVYEFSPGDPIWYHEAVGVHMQIRTSANTEVKVSRLTFSQILCILAMLLSATGALVWSMLTDLDMPSP